MAKAKQAGGSVLDILGEMTAPASAPAAPAAPAVAPEPAAATAKPLKAAVDDIEPDPTQPRTNFNEADLDDLAASFKMVGILEPLVLRETNGQAPYTKRFVILAGERRWRAAPRAGLTEVPYVLRDDIESTDVFLAQLIENTNRQDLTDFELAKSIRRVLDENKKIKQKDIAAAINRSKATISKLLGMLDDDVIAYVEEGVLQTSTDVALFKSLDETDRAFLLEKARDDGGRALTRPDFDELKASKASAAPAAASEESAGPGAGEASAGGDDAGGETPGETGAGGEAFGAESGDAGAQLEHGEGQGEGGFPDLGGDGQHDGHEGGSAGLDGLGGFAGGDGGADGGTSVATSSGSGEASGGSGPKPVSIKVKVEDFERLIPHFVDKSEDKIEVRFSADLAIALIENLGGAVPDDSADYGAKIKDLLA